MGISTFLNDFLLSINQNLGLDNVAKFDGLNAGGVRFEPESPWYGGFNKASGLAGGITIGTSPVSREYRVIFSDDWNIIWGGSAISETGGGRFNNTYALFARDRLNPRYQEWITGLTGGAAAQGGGLPGVGVCGMSRNSEDRTGYGGIFFSYVEDAGDAGECVGSLHEAVDTHTGGDNTAIIARASGGINNIAVKAESGIFAGDGRYLNTLNKVASDTIRNSHDDVISSSSVEWTKVKTITLSSGLFGQVRIFFDLAGDIDPYLVSGRIFINGEETEIIRVTYNVLGKIVEPFPTVAAGGSGYTVSDILSIDGGTDGKTEVMEVGGSGEVLMTRYYQFGSGYTTGVKTTSGGTGSGCTIDILTVEDYETLSGDITNDFNIGDTCELWVNSEVIEGVIERVFVRNFRLAYDNDSPIVSVLSTNS